MSMQKKLFGALVAAVLLVGVMVLPASADEHSNVSNPSVVVGAGDGPHFDSTFTDETSDAIYPTVGNFGAVTLNGTPQLTSAEIAPFTVIDDGGLGTGWKVTLRVQNFDDGVVAPNTKTMSAAGVAMSPPVIRAGTSGSDLGGVWGSGWTDFTAARKIVHADPADATHNGGAPTIDGVDVAGMGTYLISPQIVKLVVPVNTKPATYSAVATIAVSQTP
jgi:hypothetical protein